MNRLLFGNSLLCLRNRTIFSDGCVDLGCFKEALGEASQTQFRAFPDTRELTWGVEDTRTLDS